MILSRGYPIVRRLSRARLSGRPGYVAGNAVSDAVSGSCGCVDRSKPHRRGKRTPGGHEENRALERDNGHHVELPVHGVTYHG